MEAAAAGAVRALWNLSFNKQNLAAMKDLGYCVCVCVLSEYSVSESLACEWVLGVVTSVERARVTSSRRASSAAGLHPPQDGPSVSSAAREEFQITSLYRLLREICTPARRQG